MKINFHGGMCCGIKTIQGFGFGDTRKQMAGPLEAATETDKDDYGHHVSSSENFFTDEAPNETYLERFDRYLKFLEKRRPKGIVEIALADFGDGNPIKYWEPEFFERGFKKVTTAKNSNSDNTIHVYHLVMDDPLGVCIPEDDDDDCDFW